MGQDNKIKNIRVAAVTASAGNAVLASLNIIAGIFSNSGALIANGIDSLTDVLISVLTLAVVRIVSKPADAEHPWGHKRAETVATAFLSFLLFFTGAQLTINAVSNLINGGYQAVPSAFAVVVALISVAGKGALALSQYILGRRAGSAMIKANAKNMASDVLVSVGVLAGLLISSFTGTAHADTIIAMLIGGLIIKTAVGIFLEANLELMDGNNDIEPYRVIIDAVNSVDGAANPHRARIRKIAGFWDIVLDIDVHPEYTVAQAHDIASQVERRIKQDLENVFDIIIHVEPSGDDTDETFGLSEDMIRKTD